MTTHAEALSAFMDEMKAAADPDEHLTSLQPGQPGEGLDYNPRKPLPYPIFVAADDRCWNVPGYPLVRSTSDRSTLPTLAGFQEGDVQTVTLWPDAWRENPAAAVGLSPVFHEPDGSGMFHLSVLITSVTD